MIQRNGGVLAALTLAGILLSLPLRGEAQQNSPGHWSGELRAGTLFEKGETSSLRLSADPELKGVWSHLEFDIRGTADFRRITEMEREYFSDGSVTETPHTHTIARYGVSPSLRWSFRPSLWAVADFDWLRHVDHGISHHILSTVGLHGKLSSADGRATTTTDVRFGLLHEVETDSDVIHAPVAAAHLQQTRMFSSGGTAKLSVEIITNLEEIADLRTKIDGKLSAALTEHVSISVDARLTFRNRPTEILYDPNGWSRVYEVERIHFRLSPGLSMSF